MLRNQAGRGWRTKATIYVIASTIGGAVTGATLGAVGQLVGPEYRVAAGLALALIAVVIALFELAKGPIALLQCNRETPQSWIHLGSVTWALRNGLALGCGATSRVGFWSWYVIPISVFLIGDPLPGVVIYASYGIARGLGAWGYIVAGSVLRRRVPFDDLIVWVLSQGSRAHEASAAYLLALGLAALVVLS